MLYSYKSHYPHPLPFRIRLADGTTRTDPNTFTAAEIASAGFVEVDNPPVITSTQAISWNIDTGSWEVRDKTQDELDQEQLNSVPKCVTMRQARLALLQLGLLAGVNNAMQTTESLVSEDPELGVAVAVDVDWIRVEWEYAQTVDLNSTLVQFIAQHLQLTKQQLYEWFILAASL